VKLLVVGLNHRTAPLALRERLAFDRAALPVALQKLASHSGGDAVMVSTCNRVEIYLGRLLGEPPAVPPEDVNAESVSAVLAELRGVAAAELRPALFVLEGPDAVRHLFRVVAGLDSLVVGESQIAGQVKLAYDLAQQAGTVGPLLHALFQHARQVAKRVRTETGLSEGKLSVSSLAVEYLTQVFDHFNDKTVLVIGAGKMGELTLRHLERLRPKLILVTNRNPERAAQVAAGCGGRVLPWEHLDQGLAAADIILSTTGAAEPVVTYDRFARIVPHRGGRHVAVIDIAVPRDFDPRIARLDVVDLLVNVDDFQAVRERVLSHRLKCVPAAEAVIAAEQDRFFKEWSRRWTGPAIARLGAEWDAIRREVQQQCFGKLNGKLSPADYAVIEGAFKLLQNKTNSCTRRSRSCKRRPAPAAGGACSTR
jgi:glutamyl-tRNA reductase